MLGDHETLCTYSTLKLTRAWCYLKNSTEKKKVKSLINKKIRCRIKRNLPHANIRSEGQLAGNTSLPTCNSRSEKKGSELYAKQGVLCI